MFFSKLFTYYDKYVNDINKHEYNDILNYKLK